MGNYILIAENRNRRTTTELFVNLVSVATETFRNKGVTHDPEVSCIGDHEYRVECKG